MNKNIPNHIAIIMDGNGRWAKKRNKPRLFGHRAGVESIRQTIRACIDEGIEVLSVYAFSTENWKRPKDEVDGIFSLVAKYCKEGEENLNKLGVKVRCMGDISKLPDDAKTSLLNLIESTKNNNKFIFNIGLNYGGRAEIINAVNKLLSSGAKSCTEQELADLLYTSGLSDPDLIIRTSGEHRLSNFMLYQCAYSEFYFPKTYWPDFNKKHIKKAIRVYQKRNRRFGGLK